jgi:hypothetical protein
LVLLLVGFLLWVTHHHEPEIGGFVGVLSISTVIILSNAILQRERLECGL